MFKFKTEYKFVEYSLEGKKYAIVIDVDFVDKNGKEIHIGKLIESEHLCANESDFEDYVKNKVDYFTNKGKFICYIYENKYDMTVEGMIYILFVTNDNYEKSKRGETVSGQVILNKTLYKYDMIDPKENDRYSLDAMKYEHNEAWRKSCIELFKSSYTDESNYTVTIR